VKRNQTIAQVRYLSTLLYARPGCLTVALVSSLTVIINCGIRVLSRARMILASWP